MVPCRRAGTLPRRAAVVTTLLAIDPGHAGEGCACAAFGAGALLEVWFERLPTFAPGQTLPPPVDVAAWHASRAHVDLVIVEQPEYQGARSNGARPIDLMNLAWAGALVAGSFAGRDGCPIIAVGPRQWKGSMPKPVHHMKVLAALSVAEQRVLPGDAIARVKAAREAGARTRWAKPGASYYGRWTGHNLLDAVALGLWHLGRLRP